MSDVAPVKRNRSASAKKGKSKSTAKSKAKANSTRSTSSAESGSSKGASDERSSSKRSSKRASSKGSSGSSTSRKAVADGSAASPSNAPRRGIARLAVRPSAEGPKVRLGILWFFLALAAVTAGRGPTAVLWGLLAALAARELLVLWWPIAVSVGGAPSPRPADGAASGVPGGLVLGAVVLAVATPAAAAFGTGLAGGVLLLVVLALGAIIAAGAAGVADLTVPRASALAVAVLLPAVPATAVVLVVGAHLWAGLFLVLAVSLYDAGCFVGGAESSSLLEGPVTGIVGVLAVTFTMSVFQAPPFDTASAALVGGLCALACPVGQWVASAFLPTPDAPCRSLRRLDTYIVSAPVFLAAAWALA